MTRRYIICFVTLAFLLSLRRRPLAAVSHTHFDMYIRNIMNSGQYHFILSILYTGFYTCMYGEVNLFFDLFTKFVYSPCYSIFILDVEVNRFYILLFPVFLLFWLNRLTLV